MCCCAGWSVDICCGWVFIASFLLVACVVGLLFVFGYRLWGCFICVGGGGGLVCVDCWGGFGCGVVTVSVGGLVLWCLVCVAVDMFFCLYFAWVVGLFGVYYAWFGCFGVCDLVWLFAFV